MTGHIKLGEAGDLRDYALLDPMQYRATPINPMAAKVGSGGQSYDDYTGWSFWVQEDWSNGAGRPADTGVLFGDCATFQSRRLTAPLQCWPVLTHSQSNAGEPNCNWPWVVDGVAEVGDEATWQRVCQFVAAGAAERTLQQCWFWIEPAGDAVTVSLERCVTGAGAPTDLIGYRTVTTFDRPGPQWVLLDLGEEIDLDAGYDYYLCVESTGVVNVPYMVRDTDLHAGTLRQYDGSAWANAEVDGSETTMFCVANVISMTLAYGDWAAEEIVDAVQWQDSIWVYGRAYLYSLTAGAEPWDDYFWYETYEPVGACVDLQEFAGDLYGAHGTSGLWRLSTLGTTTEVENGGNTQPASVLCSWQGYLYVAHGNALWYTADFSTWEGPIYVGSSAYTIRGMAGMEDSLYLATEEALWRLAPGDVVQGVVPWPSQSETNGRRMVNHAGNLYIPLGNRVWMFAANGTLQDMWLDDSTQIPPAYMGQIHSLASTHLGLVATVQPTDNSLAPSVWLMTANGWHVLAVLPPGAGAGRVVTDAINKRLWIATRCGLMFSIYMEPMAAAPLYNANQTWAPVGWCEWDWYTGDLVDVDKDWESVTIYGDNITVNQPVSVYYRTTESGAWRLLGSVTTENAELRWNELSYRPAGPKLKLGVLLGRATRAQQQSMLGGQTQPYEQTPAIRAIRVKHHPMLTDRWRWQLTLPAHDGQQMPDGTINPYTGAEIRAHLDSLITRVSPFVLEDVSGTQYEVKVVGATRNVTAWRWLAPGGAPEIQYVYTLTLDQVTTESYLPTISDATLTVYGWYRVWTNTIVRIDDDGWLRIAADV